MDDLDDPKPTPPQWKKDLIVLVAEWIQGPKVLARFRSQVEACFKGKALPNDRFVALPLRALSLAEKYTRLAALHDECGDEGVKIDPRPDRPPYDASAERCRRLIESFSYLPLWWSMASLSDSDRPRMEKMADEVESDLRTRQLIPPQAPTEGGGKGEAGAAREWTPKPDTLNSKTICGGWNDNPSITSSTFFDWAERHVPAADSDDYDPHTGERYVHVKYVTQFFAQYHPRRKTGSKNRKP